MLHDTSKGDIEVSQTYTLELCLMWSMGHNAPALGIKPRGHRHYSLSIIPPDEQSTATFTLADLVISTSCFLQSSALHLPFPMCLPKHATGPSLPLNNKQHSVRFHRQSLYSPSTPKNTWENSYYGILQASS